MNGRLLVGASALLLGAAVFAGEHVPWVGLGALVLALAAAAPVARGRVARPAVRIGAAGLLTAFVAWNGLSVAWSVLPDRSWDYLNLGLVYVAFLACGLLLGGRVAPAAVAAAVAAVLGAVVTWSLAGKVFPGLYADYGRAARLRAPVGYWNALALLGDFALPLGLWLATSTRARVAGLLLVYAWVLAILLAFSRGGVLVALAVVLVWLAVDERRLDSLLALAAAGVPAVVAAVIAFRLDGITEDGQSAAVRAHDGWIFAVVLLVGAAAVAAASRLRAGRWVVLLAGAATVAAAVGLALNAGRFWDDFASAAPVGSGAARIGSTGSNFRLTWWKQAAREFADRPLFGSGAGSFAYTNRRLRTTSFDQTLEPHDLPLQFLSETGVVGFLLVAGAACVAFTAVRRRALPEERALALVPLAYVLHGLLDYDWDFVAVTGPMSFTLGVLLARPGGTVRRSYLAAVAGVSAAVAIFLSLLLPWLADRKVLAAYGQDPNRVILLAEDARSLDPLAVEPLFQEADAEAALGHYRRAWELYLDAAQIQPDNKEAWFRLGQFELRTLRRPRLALPHLERFTELDPQGPGGELYREALARVNAGSAR